MARALKLSCLLLIWSFVVAASAADWPQFLGPNHNSISSETGLNKDWNAKAPAVLWKVPMGDNGFAGPSVADGKVFIVDHAGADDIVRALKLDDGSEVWSYTYPDTAKDNYGFCRSTPVYSEGKLYVAGRLGQLICLDANSGKALWQRHLVNDFGGKPPQWLFAASPLIDGNKLIIGTGSPNGNVACLDKNTGAPLWTGGNADGASYSTAVPATILGQKQYVVFVANNAIGVNADTGKLLWSFPWITKYGVNAPQPLIEGNFVFVTSGYGAGCALYEITPEGPAQRWTNKAISSHFNSPIYYEGYIHSDSDPGNLVCMSPQAGEVCWKQGGFEKGGLIIADGTIIMLGGATGELVMAKAAPESYQELGRIKPLGGKSWTAPVLSNGRLLIRNLDTLACFDLR